MALYVVGVADEAVRRHMTCSCTGGFSGRCSRGGRIGQEEARGQAHGPWGEVAQAKAKGRYKAARETRCSA